MAKLVAAIVLLVGLGVIAAQIISGVALLGTDHLVKRSKSAGQFWFIIGVQLLGVVIACLSFAAIALGWM